LELNSFPLPSKIGQKEPSLLSDFFFALTFSFVFSWALGAGAFFSCVGNDATKKCSTGVLRVEHLLHSLVVL